MRVQNVSFKGNYRELDTVIKHPDKRVVGALDNARPYLRQIGKAMPYHRDLVISITNEDGMDTYISAYDHNKKTKETTLLARRNEHSLTEYGIDFVQDVFNGLEKNNKEDFKEIAAGFVKKLNNIMWEQHPIKYTHCDSVDIHPACIDE